MCRRLPLRRRTHTHCRFGHEGGRDERLPRHCDAERVAADAAEETSDCCREVWSAMPTRCQLDPWRGTAGGKGQAGPGGQGGQAFSGGPGAGVQELLHLVRDPPSRQGSEEGPLHEIQLQESVLFGRPEEGPREGGHAGPAAHSGVLAPQMHPRSTRRCAWPRIGTSRPSSWPGSLREPGRLRERGVSTRCRTTFAPGGPRARVDRRREAPVREMIATTSTPEATLPPQRRVVGTSGSHDQQASSRRRA